MGYLYYMDVIINENQLRFLIEGAGRPGYTKDSIRDIAKNYENYTEFITKESGAYEASRKFGPCYDKNGIEVKCYITREGGGVKKNPDNVRNTLEFFNEITSGMIRTNFGPKLVYSYTFFDDTNKVVGVYVGITNDEERRKGEHLANKSTFTDREVYTAVGNFIKENPTFKVEYRGLTEHIPFVDAQVKEKEYVDNAKSNGYNVLNIAKTGGGGANFGVPDKYLIDKVDEWIKMTKEKGMVPLLKDFTSEYKNTIYSAIGKRIRKGNDKLYGETLGKLVKKITPKTNEELIDDAMSCNSYNEFLIKYRTTSYDRARDRGLIPQIKQMFKDGLNTPNQTTPSV